MKIIAINYEYQRWQFNAWVRLDRGRFSGINIGQCEGSTIQSKPCRVARRTGGAHQKCLIFIGIATDGTAHTQREEAHWMMSNGLLKHVRLPCFSTRPNVYIFCFCMWESCSVRCPRCFKSCSVWLFRLSGKIILTDYPVVCDATDFNAPIIL